MNNNQEVTLEIYKLAIDGANKISERRGIMNGLFITLNSGVFWFIISSKNIMLSNYGTYVGFLLCCIWMYKIVSYKRINSAKFSVITELERDLPCQIYTEEWKIVKKNNWGSLTDYEFLIPGILLGIYVAIFYLTLPTESWIISCMSEHLVNIVKD